MENIGERLEEARKKAGISLREASEATKVRSDFLAAFETNRFDDIALPEIYRLGFIKLYARYLKIDPEKLGNSYKVRVMAKTNLPRREGRDIYGSVNLPKRSEPSPAIAAASETPAMEISSAPKKSFKDTLFGSSDGAGEKQPQNPYSPKKHQGNDIDLDADYSDNTLFWKVGLIFLSTIILVFILVWLFSLVRSSGGETPQTDSPATIEQRVVEPGDLQATPQTTSFTVTAVNSDIQQLQIRDLETGQLLHSGSLSAGQRLNLNRRGQIDIIVNPRENFRLEETGRGAFTIRGVGIARTTFPAD